MIPDEENKLNPDKPDVPGEAGIEPAQGESDPIRRKRVRVKVRKKIRIKKKPSAKKMIRKIAERAFWTIIIVGFVASLIIMIVQLDIRDEKFKQQRRKSNPTKNK